MFKHGDMVRLNKCATVMAQHNNLLSIDYETEEIVKVRPNTVLLVLGINGEDVRVLCNTMYAIYNIHIDFLEVIE